jgi:uncharacterized protein (TIGR03067 family)
MYLRPLACFLVTALSAASLSAQTGDKSAAPQQFDAVFSNHCKVRMAIQTESLEIETIYGKLNVPIKDIHAVEFGARLPQGAAEKIGQAVKKLGSKVESEHAGAGKALVDLGPHSYQAVLECSRANGDKDVRKRAQDVVKKLEQKFAAKELTRSQSDVVVVAKMKIVGQILTPSWKAKVEEFEHKIEIANLRTLRNIGVKEERSDLDRLQGNWQVTQLIVAGREEFQPEMTMFVSKDQVTLGSVGGRGEVGTLKLGVGEKHKTIDMVLDHEQMCGIYQFEGDMLKMCLSHRGIRPTDFETSPDGEQILLILKRTSNE